MNRFSLGRQQDWCIDTASTRGTQNFLDVGIGSSRVRFDVSLLFRSEGDSALDFVGECIGRNGVDAKIGVAIFGHRDDKRIFFVGIRDRCRVANDWKIYADPCLKVLGSALCDNEERNEKRKCEEGSHLCCVLATNAFCEFMLVLLCFLAKQIAPLLRFCDGRSGQHAT